MRKKCEINKVSSFSEFKNKKITHYMLIILLKIFVNSDEDTSNNGMM
jgi:hypothetical protein